MRNSTFPEMPAFIPEGVHRFAKMWWPKITKDEELGNVFCRLITDPRMEKVYKTLSKYEDKVKPEYLFRHTEINPDNSPMIKFVRQAVMQTHFADITKSISNTEYNRQLDHITSLLGKLDWAITLFPWDRFDNFPKDAVFGSTSITRPELFDAIHDVLFFVSAYRQDPIHVPNRVTTNVTAHTRISYILRMSRLMVTMFQRPLDNAVAITTNVALNLPDNKVDANLVRRHRRKRTIPSGNNRE